MKPYFHMWKYPRMVVWFITASILGILVRVPFISVPIIPYCLEFHPGIVLVPLFGVFWGPAGAFGVLVASLGGDLLFKQWDTISWYRALGLFFFALSAKRLWEVSLFRREHFPRLTPHWGRTLRFLIITWPGCFLASSWQALGAEVLRLYPFSYIVTLSLLNNLIFCTILAPAFYRILAREMVPRFDSWRGVMKHHGDVPRIRKCGAILIITGSLGACISGLLSSGIFYNLWPDQNYVLGEASGAMVGIMVIPFIFMQLIGLGLRSGESAP